MHANDMDELDADGLAWLDQALGADSFDAPMEPGQRCDLDSVVGSGAHPEAVPVHRLAALFDLAASVNASDIHLSVGSKPHLRVGGELRPLRDSDEPGAAELEAFLFSLISQSQRATLIEHGDLDAAIRCETRGGPLRVRASIFRQAGTFAAAFRLIASAIPSIETLGLPPLVKRLASVQHGLVLVTGKTGSGKSTTLASMIEFINQTRAAHIVTVEDPIEFQYEPARSVIQQREVGIDTKSFSIALRHALRQDPDVILLGELRDLETIRTALTAAETGHLVLATLHSGETSGAIHRLIDVFPAEQQAQVRSQLALSLQGILSQSLERFGDRLVPVTETLVATNAVRNLIRDDKVHQLKSVIETGAEDGMHTMEQSRAAVGSW